LTWLKDIPAARTLLLGAVERGGGVVMELDILGAIEGITDPELGIGIVDLGLVYRAEFTPAGTEVVMTMTSPTCPVSELVVAQVRDALHRRFPESSHAVRLTFTPPWTPTRMSEAARAQLGWPGSPPPAVTNASWTARFLAKVMGP
jgi:metal-sulfur cluster biosynthetic enzyme